MKAKLATCGIAVLGGIVAVSTLVAQSPERPKSARPKISQGTLRAGDVAPEFTLGDLEGKEEVTLSDLKGKPVVLVFGSCTCPPFVASTTAVKELYEKYQDRAHFYLIYVREAHPTDGWALASNQFQVKSPTTLAERRKIAQEFAQKIKLPLPLLVDSIDDQVEKTYSCWPNRMYILDSAGKIADAGTAGPSGTATSAKRAGEVLDALLAK